LKDNLALTPETKNGVKQKSAEQIAKK